MPPFEVVTPAPRAAWHALLAEDPTSLITQTPEWLDCITTISPYHDTSRLYRFDDGRQVLLPMVGRLPGPVSIEASWPFDWGIGGPVVDGTIGARHTEAIYADLVAQHALRLTFRPGPFADPAWRAVPSPFRATEHTTQIVDLDGGFAQAWSHRFSGNVRRAVRKAERADLEVEVAQGNRLIDVFHDLYLHSIRRWARQRHEPHVLALLRAHHANPRRKFHAVARRLGERCAVWVATTAGEPAAAIIVLRHGRHAKYWRGAMNVELANPARANDLLHRLAIEDACAAGCRYYHMGDSRPASGLARFKAGFGARAYRTDAYRYERLPFTELETRLRSTVKRCLRFRDR